MKKYSLKVENVGRKYVQCRDNYNRIIKISYDVKTRFIVDFIGHNGFSSCCPEGRGQAQPG